MKEQFLAGMAAAAILLVACKDSASPTGPKLTLSPTPTPAPSAGDVSGAWTGTFDSADPIDCDSNTPATASFRLEGTTLIGILDTSANYCGFKDAEFRGIFDGKTFSGPATGGNLTNAVASGTFFGPTLEISIRNGFGLIPGGLMHLHR